MDFFKTVSKHGLPRAEEAEVKLDLLGLQKEEALKKLNTTLEQCKLSKAASLYVGFDPARPGGGETLFQPIMRSLKVEKWTGYLLYATPIMTKEKSGIYAVFKV